MPTNLTVSVPNDAIFFGGELFSCKITFVNNKESNAEREKTFNISQTPLDVDANYSSNQKDSNIEIPLKVDSKKKEDDSESFAW